MFEWVEDVKEWFKERGDDITGLDKSFEDLIINKLLPKKYYDIYEKLEDKDKEAEKDLDYAHDDFQVASENRKRYKNELEQKEMMFKDKYGGLVSMIKNNVPLPGFRFSANGKEYHRMKREIKIAKRSHKFWARMSDEKYNIFTASEENRKIRRRALAEYKRVIVGKSKQYKDEFKFIKEYNKLRDVDENKLEDIFGADIKNRIVRFKDDIRDNWVDTERNNLKTSLNVTEATKVLAKLRSSGQITEQDKKIMESIIPQKQPNKQKSKMNIKPPVDFTKYNIDRSALEIMSKKLSVASPEELLAIIAVSYNTLAKNPNSGDLKMHMQNAAAKLKNLRQNDPDGTIIGRLAQKGAQTFESLISGNIQAAEFEKIVKSYQREIKIMEAYKKMGIQTQQTGQRGS